MTVLDTAQHEAAHIVVGVALGLRLYRASVRRFKAGGHHFMGCVEWEPTPWPREAGLLMHAAGVAWERRCGDLAYAAADLSELRRAGVKGNARIRALERAAWAVLAGRPGVHARITRALVDGDAVTAADIRRMVRP